MERCDPESGRCDSSVSGPETGTEQERIQDSADLLENPEGRNRESIMTRLWDSDEFIDDNTLTVNVARLRKKMEQIGLGGKIITKKGIGYMVEA